MKALRLRTEYLPNPLGEEEEAKYQRKREAKKHKKQKVAMVS